MKPQLVVYSIAILCFFVAGVMDFIAHEYKAGVIAVAFGAINAVIFLWR